jgi:phosphoserine phosphatase RsbU/P
MPIKSRITLMVLAVVLAMWGVLGGAIWAREQETTQRYYGALLQTQQVAWTRQEAEALGLLRETVSQLVEQTEWLAAWRNQDKARMASLLASVVKDRPGWRADVYDSRRALVYTSSVALDTAPLIESGWIARALAGSSKVDGLSQVSRSQYQWVVARRFGSGSQAAVFALGWDVATRLSEISQMLDAQSLMLNMRGREVAGLQSGIWQKLGANVSVHQSQVVALSGAQGQRWLGSVLPLRGPDSRQVGALLSLRDVTAVAAADRRAAWSTAFVGGLLLLFTGIAVFAYLRRVVSPLERSVGVLNALAQGDLRAALDDVDEAPKDESGQIARGVAQLRMEMLNLQMLRDERVRTRQQQERLIRTELKHLAESLDESSRVEILQALNPQARTGKEASEGGDNELAELAGILGRMSGLVTSQQGRLVGLLKELQASMGKQALLVSLQQELEIARSMQLSILPRVAPAIDAVDVAAVMVPAKEIGGDFYDYFLIDEHHLALVVADVSGKGVPAAFFMAISRTLLKANALFLQRPAAVLSQLNEQLCAENEQMMFVTVFFAVLDLRSGEVAYVNAGHNPPVLREQGGAISLLPSGQNMALAVMEDLPYTEGRLCLAQGDILVLYTDGVTEATSAEGTLYGEAALLDVVARESNSVAQLPNAVLNSVRQFEAGVAQADDITCVALQFKGVVA